MDTQEILSDDVLLNSNNVSILCVDDEPNILSSLKRMFALAGYSVSTVASAAEAIQVLNNQQFHIVISDMRMPIMTGVELFENIKISHPEVIKILLTGYSDLESAIGAVNQGEVYRYLTKPWNESEIINTVNSAIEYLNLKLEKEKLLRVTKNQNIELSELVGILEEKVQDRTKNLNDINLKLKDSYFSCIKSFSNLLNLRQQKLLDHSKLVADLSMKIGISMQLDTEVCQELFIAGLLHDLGKIGLSDRVLSTKVYELPHSDLELYKSHASLGSSCLKSLDGMKSISEMIKFHHERVDGNGYPDGLMDGKIPIGAKILGVVETYFELMEGDLSSTKKSSLEAQTVIIKYKKMAFDPIVVSHFIKVLHENNLPSVQTDYQISIKDKKDLQTNSSSTNKNSSVDVKSNSILPGQMAQTNARPGQGSDPLKNLFSLKQLEGVISQFKDAVIMDKRNEEGGFLWVRTGIKKFNQNDDLDQWLKKHRFIYSENHSAWYFPFD